MSQQQPAQTVTTDASVHRLSPVFRQLVRRRLGRLEHRTRPSLHFLLNLDTPVETDEAAARQFIRDHAEAIDARYQPRTTAELVDRLADAAVAIARRQLGIH